MKKFRITLYPKSDLELAWLVHKEHFDLEYSRYRTCMRCGGPMRQPLAENALSTLWNEEAGIYENRDLVSGELSARHAPTNFYSLFSRKVTAEQKRLMMEKHLLNPDEFWGDYVLPSVARSDAAYPEQIYWRGRIWAPLNAIVYEALKDAGLIREAKMLALKSEELLLLEWRKHRHVHENYFATDGFACDRRQSDVFYHWGALLGYIAIDSEKMEELC